MLSLVVLALLFHLASLWIILRNLRASGASGRGWSLCLALAVLLMFSHRWASLDAHVFGEPDPSLIASDASGLAIAAFLTVATAFLNPLVTLRALEASRRRSEELLHLMVAGARDYALYVLDRDGRVIQWNAGAERLFGYRSEEILGRSLDRTYRPEDAADGPSHARTAADAEGRFEEVKVRLRKDGTPFWAQTLTTPLRDPDGLFRGYAKMTRDVTERRSLELQLRQSQKMEDFGRLAGGVAHDFNNLLTVINGYAEFLLAALPERTRMKEDAEQIARAGERAASLTRQLLAFSRKQRLEPRILDLDRVVGEMEKMLRRLIGEDVDFVTRFGAGLPRIKADPSQVEQVIMNLALNARDAMPDGGRLEVETSAVDLDEAYADAHPGVRPGRYVALSVRDTGTGMGEETLSRIFEPFFTTKEPGKGTGLGLATVFGIVKQSGGHIEVESALGQGTTFRVHFPAAAQGAKDAPTPAPAALPRPRAVETVLLVEDDAAVRRFAAQTLESEGYTVLEAADGRQALEIVRSRTATIDLLLTDTVMPGMGGTALAEKARQIRPGLKVFYMTGYAETAIFRDGLPWDAVLTKPFTSEALWLKTREILGPPAAA